MYLCIVCIVTVCVYVYIIYIYIIYIYIYIYYIIYIMCIYIYNFNIYYDIMLYVFNIAAAKCSGVNCHFAWFNRIYPPFLLVNQPIFVFVQPSQPQSAWLKPALLWGKR